MNTNKEEDLLKQLKTQDTKIAKETLCNFYLENWKSAKNFMESKGLSQMDCEDLYQDAMTIFYKKIRSPSFELSSSLKTFLFGILKNLIFAQRRKNNKISPSEIHEGSILAEDLEQLYLEKESKNILIQKIQSLGAKCQQVLQLYYFEQLSMKEIAVKMNYSSNHVAKNKKSHCLNKLKQSFTQKSKLEL